MAITLPILNWFSKFFHCWKKYFPPYLQYVAALPCESYKFEFWNISGFWTEMQTKV